MTTATIQAIQTDTFESLLEKTPLLFVDFWASWCAPCKQFAHIYEQVASKYPNICFASVNIEKETALADLFQIRSIPHLMVFKQGIAIYSESGSMPESTLLELVEQALDADVSSILDELKDEASGRE